MAELTLRVTEEHAVQIAAHMVSSGYEWPLVEGRKITISSSEQHNADLWLRDWDLLKTIPEGVDLLCTLICAQYEAITGIEVENDK